MTSIIDADILCTRWLQQQSVFRSPGKHLLPRGHCLSALGPPLHRPVIGEFAGQMNFSAKEDHLENSAYKNIIYAACRLHNKSSHRRRSFHFHRSLRKKMGSTFATFDQSDTKNEFIERFYDRTNNTSFSCSTFSSKSHRRLWPKISCKWIF